ncbi:class I SAM-dependent methyltransferase [Kitasatospora sp. GP82]|uniref:class I SAM-dependent methyltransferase n=1 Tax=Kitasatospora sp. GP82 TaxID=3035089 RepID=UPI002474891F|nr:class I SAM-dependent methyltransferase [Kitasatospora sp. GP82]MDH6125381.1 SAM-dependent methyltransferase [Kitasatospora sp. GP82]
MTFDASDRDVAAKGLWNDHYGATQQQGNTNLWGDPPVPYAATAARLFADHGAFVVLDLPCGDGRNLPPLTVGAPVVVGADTSRKALDFAATVVEKAGERNNVVLLELDAVSTGLPSGSVDGILCWDLLGHLEHPEPALHELHRILRPGGHLVANMWTMNDCQVTDPNIRHIEDKKYIDHFDYYCRFYDRPDLDALLDSVGMAAKSVETQRWWEPPHVGYRDYEHEHESLIFVVQK